MGIRISSNTKKRATLKLYNAMVSYRFKQEFDELESATSSQRRAINECIKALGEMIKE